MPDRNNSKTQTTSDLPQQCRYTWYTGTHNDSKPGKGGEPPVSRCKHASYVDDGILYVHGGRNGGMCYREMWRCDLAEGFWEKVKCRGDQPLSPQEHTIVAHKNKLYVFGGQFCCSTDTEPPLWMLDLKTMVWSKQLSHGETVTPGGRRGHTAVVFHDTMCIYGGYVDLKGSSNEIWNYDLREEVWQSVNHSSTYDFSPDGRHSHSAAVHEGAMWVYGGMSDLQPRDDLWRWDFICSQWNRVKSRPSPPPLKGHSACCVQGQMLMFGGASQGSPSNSLWCFHFGTYAWMKLVPLGPSPPVCIHHCSVVIATSSEDGKPGSRSQSCPQLKKSSLRIPIDTCRPYSSPPLASSASEPHVIFHNKISPVEDGKVKPLTVNLNTAKVDSEKSTKNMVQEYSGSTTPESLSPTSSFTRKLWCRSTSCISNDENMSEDIPLSEIRRSASIDSLSLNSGDYMDTVAGSYVNRILTAVNNLQRHMYHVVPTVVVDDSPASYKRQKSADTHLEPPRSKGHANKQRLPEMKEDLPCASGGSFSESTGANINHRPAGASDADDLQVVDMDDSDEDLTYTSRSGDTSHTSDDTLNISSTSETALLLSRPAQSRSVPQSHGRSEVRSVVRCFQGNYSRLSNSSDSLPYGIVNPLCNASQPRDQAPENLAPRERQWKETRDSQVDRLRAVSPAPLPDPAATRINKDTSKLGVHRARQETKPGRLDLSMRDPPGRARVSVKDPCGPGPRPVSPPPYESIVSDVPEPPSYREAASDDGSTDLDPLLPSGSSTAAQSSSRLTRSEAKRNSSGRSDKIPTAWAGASPEKNSSKVPVPVGSKKDLQVTLGATGGETVESSRKSYDWATTKTQVDSGPQNYIVYIVGGQTSEGTRLGAKPLLMLKLGIETGVR